MTRESPRRSAATENRPHVALALFVVGSVLALVGTALDSVDASIWKAAGTIVVPVLSGLMVIRFRRRAE